MVRSRIGRAGLLVGGAVAALVLGACNPTQTAGQGQGDAPTLPTFTSSASESPSSTTSEPTTSEPTSTQSPTSSKSRGGSGASSSGECKAAGLRAQIGRAHV